MKLEELLFGLFRLYFYVSIAVLVIVIGVVLSKGIEPSEPITEVYICIIKGGDKYANV